MRAVDDLKSALFLSGSFAVAAAATLPLLLPTLPPEARDLPLPVPAFSALLGVQLTVVYGLLGFAGMRLGRARGREPAPALTALWAPRPAGGRRDGVRVAVPAGLACGTLLVGAVAGIQRFLPGTLPATLHPPGPAAALLASTAGSIGEEILFRLFGMSLLLWLLPQRPVGAALAVGASALAFGMAHAPAFVFLFGGWREVPPVSWAWLIALNGVCGVTYGVVFLRYGILGAILAHFSTDCVWHLASELFRRE